MLNSDAKISARARVLVHGATGFTGKLVCEALRRRSIPFAISGRSREKLEDLAGTLGGSIEVCLVDIQDPATIERAIAGRAIVCACAGPFVDVGEPVLAACARAGVHYVDTTGEQAFVARAIGAHDATARASGACIVPAMGYDLAPAAWAADMAAAKVGGTPDEIAIFYAVSGADGKLFGTSRGSKRSALGIIASDDGQQYVDGALVAERPGTVVRPFEWTQGESAVGASYPSANANVIPAHTGARTVRTFLAVSPMTARALHATRAFAPLLARLAQPLLERAIARSKEGPDDVTRQGAPFRIRAEAARDGQRESVVVSGCDPYGLTGELIAYAAGRACANAISVSGVVAPSAAFPARQGLEALRPYGVQFS